MLPTVPFWFLRHGQTDYNARGLSQGALDIPLNDTGRAQAAEAGRSLAARGIMRIVSSPMLRTRQTTEIVNAALALPVSFEADLHEVVFGGMEGQPLGAWFAAWLDGTSTPPGAESFTTLSQRVAAVMTQILARPGLPLIVAHGAVFRAVRTLLGLQAEGLTGNAIPLLCAPSPAGWQVSPASP